jgi:ankyrin repeat protein
MLLQAIQDQSPGLVQAALESGADVNSRDNHGRTPLMHAAKLGNLAIVQMLLAAGANVWDRDSDGKLPLIYTETGDHVEAARAIGSAMRAEADPQWMREALAQFADGDYALVAGLFAAGADGSGFPFIVAIQSGEVPIVEEFLKASVNVNTVHKHTTALIHAVGGGQPEIVRLLLAAGADVNQPAPDGSTPLQAAQQCRRKGVSEEDWQEIIRMLKEAGAIE